MVLGAGWSGERVLVRLLSAVGSVRVGGQVLDHPVRDPAGHLRSAISPNSDGQVRGAVVLGHHLWLLNGLDSAAFVADLVADGIIVLALARSAAEDRGLSLALCGPRTEVVPSAPRHVDAGDVALYAQESEMAVEWFDTVCPDPAHRFVLEHDLATAAARQACVERLAALLGLDPWEAPPDAEVPDHDALWRAVANANALAGDLAQIRSARQASEERGVDGA